MGLRVNTNVAAINAHRQLLGTDLRMGRNMERLSSGFRINHASDDAAGLAIANRLRTNIRSLSVASRNTNEGKSMVTVAEGAAGQIEGILERMKELATQGASSNAGSDLAKIDAEYNQLYSEINRIANDTEYQGTKLIQGTFGATAAQAITGLDDSDVTLNGAATGVYTFASSGTVITGTFTDSGGMTTTQTVTFAQSSTLDFDKLGLKVDTDSSEVISNMAGSITVGGEGGTFQVGSGNTSAEDQISVTLGDMTTDTGLGLGSVDLSTQSNAQSALTTIDTAINTVGTRVGAMGATINRFDYAYANLQVSIENFQSSESIIRDVDMAGEMVSFTKNQILLQAGTAMLAQANMSTQGVLTLMR